MWRRHADNNSPEAWRDMVSCVREAAGIARQANVIWNIGGLIRLQGEPRLTDVTRHEATEDIPQTLARTGNHGKEWLDACRGEGKTFSDFDIGGKLTEIGLTGVVGIRTGRTLEWDGDKMEATNAPEAARFVHTEYRTKWLT